MCRYSYTPDLDSDPFGADGALWSFNYFLYNRKLRRILFFTCRALSPTAPYQGLRKKAERCTDECRLLLIIVIFIIIVFRHHSVLKQTTRNPTTRPMTRLSRKSTAGPAAATTTCLFILSRQQERSVLNIRVWALLFFSLSAVVGFCRDAWDGVDTSAMEM